jgi:hypothetical protein
MGNQGNNLNSPKNHLNAFIDRGCKLFRGMEHYGELVSTYVHLCHKKHWCHFLSLFVTIYVSANKKAGNGKT